MASGGRFQHDVETARRDARGGVVTLALHAAFVVLVVDRLVGPFVGLAAALGIGVLAARWLLRWGATSLALADELERTPDRGREGEHPVAEEIRRRHRWYPRLLGKGLVLSTYLVWLSWDPPKTLLVAVSGAALGTLPWAIARTRLRAHARPPRWRHDTRFRNYHALAALLFLLSVAFTAYAKTAGAWAVTGALVVLYYAEVRVPAIVLNAEASRRYRRPRFPRLCAALGAAHPAINYVLNALNAGIVVTVLASGFGPGHFAWLVASMLPASMLAYHFGIRGELALLKRLLAGPVRIVALRRYSPGAAQKTRGTILPIAGAFGYIACFEDETFAKSEGGSFWESQDLLSGTFYQIGSGEPDWKARIDFEFSQADYAIFDWDGEPTPNMAEEFKMARQRLPWERMIWIVPRAWRQRTEEWLAERSFRGAQMVDADGSSFEVAATLARMLGQALDSSRPATP